MGKLNEGGIFRAMKFPDYVYQEFPKAVKNSSGKTVIVHSAREELAVASEPSETALEAVPPIVEERDTLARKLAEAQAQIASLTAAQQPAPKPASVLPLKPKV